MIKHLRLRLTLFNTAITGAVLVSLTFLCLFVSEKNIRDNAYESFQNNMNRVCAYLQEGNQVSLSWLHQMESTDGCIVSILDQGKPLFSTGFYRNQEQALAGFQQALQQVHRTNSKLDSGNQHLFFMEGSENYYAGISRIYKNEGNLDVILLYPLRQMEQGIFRQRIIVWTGAAVALGLLGLFSWCFTGKMLKPIQENQQRQAEFVAAASHELRTPLAGILSAAGAMEKAEGTDKVHFYGMIQREGQRMTKLIGDMLTLASGDSGSWEVIRKPVELDMLLLNVYEIFLPRAREKSLKLTIGLPEQDMPIMQLDPERMEQALGVLLDNAISYTPVQGKIQLNLTIRENRARVTVSDSGPGVPDAEKEKIFQRFHRSEKARTDRGHFGLGLSIAAEIVELHGGKLWVEDAPMGGAAFIMELPISRERS